ncbi:MAG TPA: isoprenylcysteine carboxylmethyltransferase family protein [Thermoanaerobaculia bacterium]|nr:isoprenylcysteine carboxylmethyltransferase family protein [Thermoanaerobaculia bacterium]
MNPWLAKAVILIASIVMIIIRAPHGQRSRGIKVAKSHKGPLEIALLTLAGLAFFVPLVWIATPAFAFAEYPLRPIPLVAGTLCLALGLWIFHRAHADLGTNWSITLEMREQHRLITQGVYRYARHPMYLALFLYSLGQAIALPCIGERHRHDDAGTESPRHPQTGDGEPPPQPQILKIVDLAAGQPRNALQDDPDDLRIEKNRAWQARHEWPMRMPAIVPTIRTSSSHGLRR